MSDLRILGIIPARFGSTRLAGKALLDIAGKPMIQHVQERAGRARSLSQVVVATDDVRIEAAVRSFGGKVVMTSPDHPSGTDRCAEALRHFDGQHFDAVINIQGDEPFIDPAQIDLLAGTIEQKGVELATLVQRITELTDLEDRSKVKVVVDHQMNALYFSRAAIPFLRKVSKEPLKTHRYYKHVGIYAYRTDCLQKIVKLGPSSLELAESLEQLRWLENGYAIRVAETHHESAGVDTPEDLERARARARDGS